jgi:hypothetical protein
MTKRDLASFSASTGARWWQALLSRVLAGAEPAAPGK